MKNRILMLTIIIAAIVNLLSISALDSDSNIPFVCGLASLIYLILVAVANNWGEERSVKNARHVANMEVAQKITVAGRLQSREYTKRINENESEPRTAYEFSVSKLIEGGNTDESIY